jgi:hypothetical protein
MSVREETSCDHGRIPDLDGLHEVQPESRRRGRNPSKATLAFYRINRHRVALKTFADHPFPVRWLVGWWSIGREARNYEAVAGAPGLAPYHGRLGRYALATEWLRATPLAELEAVAPEVFDRLEEVVAGLHRRGLALGDLHHGDVLVAEDGSVYLVDLATAWLLGERPGRLRRSLFSLARDFDRIAMARLRARFTGADPDAEVERVGGAAAVWYRRGKRAKAAWDRLRGKRSRRH